METDGKANVHFHDGFCCYYRQKTLFVWEYHHHQFELPLNLCSHEFDSPITSAFVGPIEYDRKELGSSLVLVAYGHTIELFTFYKGKLEPLMIRILGSDVVTKLSIWN